MNIAQRILGMLLIASGAAIIGYMLADLVLRLIVAAFGLWIVNYGLKVMGQPSLGFLLARWVAFRRFF